VGTSTHQVVAKIKADADPAEGLRARNWHYDQLQKLAVEADDRGRRIHEPGFSASQHQAPQCAADAFGFSLNSDATAHSRTINSAVYLCTSSLHQPRKQ
jgi:hypothetical protein